MTDIELAMSTYSDAARKAPSGKRAEEGAWAVWLLARRCAYDDALRDVERGRKCPACGTANHDALIAQGMLDAVELLRCHHYDDTMREAVVAIELRAEQIRAAADHSGVAGEPEATEKESCCPESGRSGYSHTEVCPGFEENDPARPPQIAVEPEATRGHDEAPVNPATAILGGGVVVSDEAVEAAARAVFQYDHLDTDPDDWDDLSETDRDSYRDAARAYLRPAAAPIVEQYLRTRLAAATVEPTTEHHEAAVREWLRDTGTRAAMVDALRSAADDLDQAIAGALWGHGGIDRLLGGQDVAAWLRRRADGLERGTDQ